jgi:hypothetical protein
LSRLRSGRWALAVANIAVISACGGSKTESPTQPTPAPAPVPVPAAPVVVHDSLQPLDNRQPTRLYESAKSSGFWYYLTDDFVSPVNTEIRVVRWQGGYCDPRYQVPLAVPRSVSRSFSIWISADNGTGRRPAAPANPPGGQLIDAVFAPADAHEELLFEVLDNGGIGCGSKETSPASYFQYTATLPRPVPVTQGGRYWIAILGDTGDSGITWGWRVGRPDNGYTLPSFTADGYYPFDMAFSVASQ